MFSLNEARCQASPDKHGRVEVHNENFRRKRPAWLVLLKLLGVAAMVAVGYAIALPTFREHAPHLPQWKGVVAIAAAMLFYTGLAYFIRPEANGDNMGWLGGSVNDPTQSSDNVNRLLWKAHMILGPGRFTAEALLDACILIGLVDGDDPGEQGLEYTGASPESILASAKAAGPSPTSASAPASSPYQLAPPVPGGGVQLDSWKYFQNRS